MGSKGKGGKMRFSQPPGGTMMKQVQQLQAQMMQAQEQLGQETVTASVGGGAVTVVMTGQQEVRSVKISPEAANPEDVEMLQDLIVAAVNEGVRKAQEMASAEMARVTGGMKLPGMM